MLAQGAWGQVIIDCCVGGSITSGSDSQGGPNNCGEQLVIECNMEPRDA